MIVVIDTAQFHLRKAEVIIFAGWYPAASLSQARDGETYDNSFSRIVHHRHHYQRDEYSIAMGVIIWKIDSLLDRSENKTCK